MTIFHKERLSVEEALVLRSIPFRDFDQILTLFSKERGLFSAFVPFARTKKRGYSLALQPTALVEASLSDKGREMLSMKELTVVDAHQGLRDSFDKLQSALSIVDILSKSQKPGQKEPLLYALTKVFLKALEHTLSPEKLLSFYLLKLLSYEGVLHLSFSCHACNRKESPLYFPQGEALCSRCSPLLKNPFTTSEIELLQQALSLKSISALEALPPPPSLKLLSELILLS